MQISASVDVEIMQHRPSEMRACFHAVVLVWDCLVLLRRVSKTKWPTTSQQLPILHYQKPEAITRLA